MIGRGDFEREIEIASYKVKYVKTQYCENFNIFCTFKFQNVIQNAYFNK